MNGTSVFLANAAFFYPVYWLSMFLVRAGPALLHIVFLRHHLLSFEVRPLWIQVACCPPGPFPAHERFDEATILKSLVVLGLVALAFLALRKHRAVAGFVIAAIGQTALTAPLTGLVFGRRSFTLGVSVFVFAAIVFLGLALISSSVDARYLKRLAAPVIAFCLPLAIFSSLYVWGWQVVLLFTAPSLLLAPLAALWNRPPACNPALNLPTALRRFAFGFSLSLLLVAAIHAAQSAHDRSQQSARQALLSTVPKPAASSLYPKLFFQRGVNLTAEGPVGYDPQSALPVLDKLKSCGVDSIALVPYGFASTKEPTVRYGASSMERSDDIAALTALAHQRGIKVLLKPQLWCRSGFPGNLDFPDPRRRAQWFAEYRKFLEYYAALAARMHADIFSIGVELGKMTPYEAEWRSLIARARALYPGPLVYSATQGPEFETIRFWDALDYIGLNEYYPLPDDLSTTSLVRTVETVQAKFARPVMFTEAGFTSYANPHRAPWDETPRALSPADQARCYEAVLKAFYTKPWFQGVYWWKVGTDNFGGPTDGSHTPWGKPAMDVVERWYLKGGR